MSTLILSLLSLQLSGADADAIAAALIRSDDYSPGHAGLTHRYADALAAARDASSLFASIRPDSPTAARQKRERSNVAAIVEALLAAGYSLNLDNGGDGHDGSGRELASFTTDARTILAEMFATDEERLLCKLAGKVAAIYFVYGNADDGSEVAADWSVSLSPVIEPVIDGYQPA